MTDWTIETPREPPLSPEGLTDEHRAIARTVDEFWVRDVAQYLDAIRAHKPGVARSVVKKAGELGLTAMQIPEAYGGHDLDLPSVMTAVEHLSTDASYLGWHFAHSGIGTLPLVFYGTDEQKRRYLPRLATVELLGAYALTEPHAGSDARAATTRAELSADGRFYELTGEVMPGYSREGDVLRFRVRERAGRVSVPVRYRGVVPDPFRAGREVIVTVKREGRGFVAERDSLIPKCLSKFSSDAEAS